MRDGPERIAVAAGRVGDRQARAQQHEHGADGQEPGERPSRPGGHPAEAGRQGEVERSQMGGVLGR